MVTARGVRVEGRLAETEELARLIIDSAADYAIFTTDVDRRVTSWSAGAEAIFGWAEAEIVGEAADVLFTPEDRAAGVPAREAAIARETGCAPDVRWHIRKDGERFFADGSARPLHDAAGAIRGYLKVARDATTAHRAEEARRADHARLRQIIEQAPEKMWLNRADGRVEYFNAAWRSYTDQPDGDADLGWTDEVHPDDRARMLDVRARGIASGEGYRLDVRLRRASDGAYRWHAVSVAPIRGDDGQVAQWVGVASDVDDVRRGEERLRDSEALLRAVLDALPVGVIIADAQGRIIRDNAANRELWGVPPETTSWKGYDDWIGFWPDTGERIPADGWAMARALLHGEVVRDELVENQRFGTGERRLYLNNAAPIRDAEGKIVGGVVAELDVTDRLAIERALRETEDRYRLAARATKDAVWDWDLASDRIEWGGGAAALFGRPPGEAEANGTWWRDAIHPDDRERVMCDVQAAIASDHEGVTAEYRLRRADGTYADVLDRGYVLRGPDGRARRLVGAIQDITERKLNEARLREALDHQRTLTAEIDHRVKNSLQLVAGLLSMQAHDAPEAVREALLQAQQRIASIAGLHDRLWRQEDARSVDLADFLSDLAERLQASASGFDVTCSAIEAQVPTERAVSIGLVVNEAATNAMKYAYPDGRGLIAITLEAPTGDTLRVTVADQGMGFPAVSGAHRPSLGSRLMRGMARQLGGEVRFVQGHPGARVELSFPRPPH